MPRLTIADPKEMRLAIQRSHKRCQKWGSELCGSRPEDRVRLTEEELAARREENRTWLDVAMTHIKELYRFLAGAGFAVGLVDSEGFLLELIGDKPVLEKLYQFDCWPGFRWTEKDVGTCAVSLALATLIPIQLTDDEHFIRNANNRTCSASPMFDEEGRLLGVISLTGVESEVHPHTLGMVVTSTMAIQNELRIRKKSQELLVRNKFMEAIVESFDRGVMAVDREGQVTHINDPGRRILGWPDDLASLDLTKLMGGQFDLEGMLQIDGGYIDRESFIPIPGRTIHLLNTAKPIMDSEGNVHGVLFIFDEIKRIRKLVNDMSGSTARFTFNHIIGRSPALEKAKKLAVKAAAGNSTVLILGETGTGKELFAQAIHNRSARQGNPFVAINCGAIPRELLESELFGYVDGAFTGARRGGRPGKFELASGGTIFLDEIGDMPVNMQVKLLRVLQTGEVDRIGQNKPIAVDLRIIAATHAKLDQALVRGTFRQDLYYRLNVFPIHIPPLRERTGDVNLLAGQILLRCCQALDKNDVSFSPEAEALIVSHSWPGNVRELENVIERAVNLVEGRFITPDHLDHLGPGTKNASPSLHRGNLLVEAEQRTIEEVLQATENNISKAAEMLGISRTTLYSKIKTYGLSGQ